VWTGSCPCQPFSKAGKGGGFADQRHLWPAWFHIVSQCRPPVIFGEQVAVAIKHGWVDLVMADLESKDYACGIQVFRASDVGAPHERKRLYFAADRIGQGVEGQFSGKDSSQPGPWGWRGEEDLQAIANAPLVPGNRWPKPLVRRVDHGLSSCMGRLRAYGNAIVPQQAAQFILAYSEARGLIASAPEAIAA
jgi:DNA (cytosine-5)-methyltransferase 1